jgi:chemotaxis protein methyltransferase CheR
MNRAEFDYLRRLIRDRSAIFLDDSKEYLVRARLEPVARRHGLSSLAELVHRLQTNLPGELHGDVVEAMTTNETSFFRDTEPFETLRREILPPLIKSREKTRRLDIWSAACSSGQEAYSIAMLIDHHLPALAGWKTSILGTDLARGVVERARNAVFSQIEVGRGLPAPMLARYFEREGTDWRLRADIARRVTFRQMNLTDPWHDVPQMDVVFMRNVLIYFDVDVKRTMLDRVAKVLRPDGALLLGAGETTINLDSRYQAVHAGKTVYYRLKSAA